MRRLRVVNRGKKTRHRVGVGFPPNKEVEVTVSNREYLTVKAVRDFEVTILDDEKKKDAPETSGNEVNSAEFNLSELNVSEVLKIVQEGKLKPEEAIALELTAKNRTTLIEKLENMKEGH